MKIFIDDKYYDAVPRPSKSERVSIKQSIQDEGQLTPIIVNENGKILDGHTRFEICQELGIDCKCVVKKFDNLDDEKEYVILVNLKRRHLTPFQISFLIDDLRDKWKKETRMRANQNMSQIMRGLKEATPRNERRDNLSHLKAAEICGIESCTMQKIDYIKKHGNTKQIQFVRDGLLSVEQCYRDLVQERHTTNAPNIRNTRSFPLCEECGGVTRFSGKCHVHSSYCCTKCKWGS